MITIIGCGNAGCKTVEWCKNSRIEGNDLYRENKKYFSLKFYAVNTDPQQLLPLDVPNKLLVKPYIPKGTGKEELFQVGVEAGECEKKSFSNILDEANIVIVACDLSEAIDAGITAFITEMAFNTGKIVIPIVTYPFKEENSIIQGNARQFLEKMTGLGFSSGVTIIVIPKDQLRKVCPKLPLNQIMGLASEIIMQYTKTLLVMMFGGPTKLWIIGLTDYNDFNYLFKNGGIKFIGFGRSKGKNRMIKALKEALHFALPDPTVSDSYPGFIYINAGIGKDPIYSWGVSEKLQKESWPVLERTDTDYGCVSHITYDSDMGEDVELMVMLNNCGKYIIDIKI